MRTDELEVPERAIGDPFAIKCLQVVARNTVFWDTHLGAFLAIICFSWSGLVIAFVLYGLSGLGVTVGLHRLLTHRSFETTPTMRRFWATLGALANQGGVLEWVAVHREHHHHADADGDPHSPVHGFWHAHFLWYLRYDSRFASWESKSRYVKDIADDGYLRFLDTWFLPLQLGVFVLLWIAGDLWSPGLGMSWAVYGVFVRIVFLQQITALVNSATHSWGRRSFPTRDRATNLWWLALLSFGEGWHNNHHAFPWSAAIGHSWRQWDPGYWCISLMERTGLAWNVKRPATQGNKP